MASDKVFNVLFLCTHNSARSIMAEVIVDYVGRGKFKGFSAGSQPATAPNPFALATLQRLHFSTDGLYSKNWDEFAKPDAPIMDFVLTVCDDAAGKVCPIWPGQPMTAHWGIQDPAAAEGTDQDIERVFTRAFRELDARIKIFTSLRLDSLDKLSLQRQLDSIGQMRREK